MDTAQPNYRPGEIFIERYMPDATEEQRNEARSNLRELVKLIVAIDARLTQIGTEKRDSRESPA